MDNECCFHLGKEWGVKLTTHLYLVLSGNVNHINELVLCHAEE